MKQRKPFTARERDALIVEIEGLCVRFQCAPHTIRKFATILETAG